MGKSTIIAHQITGDFALNDRTAAKIYALVSTGLSEGDIVEVDFSGVRITSFKFWAYAIAPLLDKYSTAQLNDQLKICNLNSADQVKLQQAINNKKNSIWSKA
jgi:STAS-like domain of unknown function (DUF4325)